MGRGLQTRIVVRILTYRAAKTHRMPYLYTSFSAKEPYNEWLFWRKGPATYKTSCGSSPPCTWEQPAWLICEWDIHFVYTYEKRWVKETYFHDLSDRGNMSLSQIWKQKIFDSENNLSRKQGKEKDACIRKETWKKRRIFTTTIDISTGRPWSGWCYTQKTKNARIRTETRKRDVFSLLLTYLQGD